MRPKLAALVALAGWLLPAIACASALKPCGVGGAAALSAAAENTLLLDALDHSLFGRAERGWRVYEVRIAADLGESCIPESPAFADTLARWQTLHGLPGDGVVRADTLAAFKAQWQAQRPFMSARAMDICPDAPRDTEVAALPPSASAGGENPLNPLRLRADALAAFLQLRAAAQAELPEAAANPEVLGAMSGFRPPAYDAGRCAQEGNCNGVVRATCSAHRTGLAVDLFVGALPPHKADDSADDNRQFQTHGVAYRWLVANAGRFGFVNYVFEPWHWEWVPPGPPPAP